MTPFLTPQAMLNIIRIWGVETHHATVNINIS